MSTTRSRPRALRAAASAAASVAVIAALTGCSAFDGLTGSGDESASPSASPSASATPYESQFTQDGTFQSHINKQGVDFVYTLYPTKSTPRTNEWYPGGNKYFSFTFQAYDLDRDLRDPFKTKRKVYLQHITVTSQVVTTDGSPSTEQPYSLDAVAKDVTFDPDPQHTKKGMLITSPKGAFELRNQTIQPTAATTKGIDLTFSAVVWVERRAGSGTFDKQTISQKVPIAIFSSDKPTAAQSIPVDAN